MPPNSSASPTSGFSNSSKRADLQAVGSTQVPIRLGFVRPAADRGSGPSKPTANGVRHDDCVRGEDRWCRRRVVLLAAVIIGGLTGCGRDPEIVATTRLPIKPPGYWDYLFYAMCDAPTKRPDDAVRVIWFEKVGHKAFEQTIRCDIVRPKGPPPKT